MTAAVSGVLDYVTRNLSILAFTSRVKTCLCPSSFSLPCQLTSLALVFDFGIPKTKFAFKMQPLSWNRKK